MPKIADFDTINDQQMPIQMPIQMPKFKALVQGIHNLEKAKCSMW